MVPTWNYMVPFEFTSTDITVLWEGNNLGCFIVISFPPSTLKNQLRHCVKGTFDYNLWRQSQQKEGCLQALWNFVKSHWPLYQAGVLQPDCGGGACHLLHGDGARAGDHHRPGQWWRGGRVRAAAAAGGGRRLLGPRGGRRQRIPCLHSPARPCRIELPTTFHKFSQSGGIILSRRLNTTRNWDTCPKY